MIINFDLKFFLKTATFLLKSKHLLNDPSPNWVIMLLVLLLPDDKKQLSYKEFLTNFCLNLQNQYLVTLWYLWKPFWNLKFIIKWYQTFTFFINLFDTGALFKNICWKSRLFVNICLTQNHNYWLNAAKATEM